MAPLIQDEATKKYLLSQFSPKLTDDLTTGSSQQLSSSPIVSPAPEMVHQPVPTDTGTPSKDITDAGKDERITDSSPAHQPQDFMGAQMADLDKYGPDQEKAVMDNILQSRGSFGNRAARGFAGLGDALMSVAGKSSPGFLNNLNEREASQEKLQAEELPMLQGMQSRQIGLKQGMEARVAAPGAYRAAFKQLFPQMPETELALMSSNPDVAEKIFPGIGYIIEKQIQAQSQKEGLDVQKARLAAETTNQEEQRNIQNRNASISAAEKRAKMGVLDRNILHRDEAKLLEEEMNRSNAPEISSQEAYENLPSGSEYMANGVRHRKK